MTTSERNIKKQTREQSSHNTDKTLLDNGFHTGAGNFYTDRTGQGVLLSGSFQNSQPSVTGVSTWVRLPGRILGFCLAVQYEKGLRLFCFLHLPVFLLQLSGQGWCPWCLCLSSQSALWFCGCGPFRVNSLLKWGRIFWLQHIWGDRYGNCEFVKHPGYPLHVMGSDSRVAPGSPHRPEQSSILSAQCWWSHLSQILEPFPS